MVGGVESIPSRDRPLRIAVIAPPWYSLPPRGYGGVELVVNLLARELRRRGHLVTLFGAEGSEIGTTVCAPRGLDVHLGQATQVLHEMTYLARVEHMLRLLGPFEVISDHAGFGGALVSSLFDTTAHVLHTVHGPIGVSELEFYDSLPTNGSLVAISGSQRSQAPRLAWAGVVHNAVDLDGLYMSPADRDPRYLLCLARICEEKGQDVAIEVARRCGLPLILAGKVEQTPASRAFFRRRVEPFIDGAHVRYFPSITGAEKARLIAGATAMLAPISWPEPFGLSIVEAMVSGTPAVSFRQGAAPELIEPGMTGFLVDDIQEMVDAVGQSFEVDPYGCARAARERFSPQVMARSYLRLYRLALTGAQANRTTVVSLKSVGVREQLRELPASH
jgi:glycosyltransferase involved in cell wall biosynthesis